MSLGAIYQVITFAWQSFWRNFWLSLVTITIIALAILSINFLIIINVLSENTVTLIQDKIDVSIYFKPEVIEPQVLEVQTFLSALTEVKNIVYVSQPQALQNFRQRHQQDQIILESLTALDDNPLGATLVIKAKGIEDYPAIIAVLDNSRYNTLIADKSFDDNKLYIAQIKQVSDNINRIGLAASGLFIIIALLIVFNTIRVAIYTHREEIAIMKLVGATNWFIRSPFLLESIFYGFIGAIIALAITYPTLNLIQPYVNRFFLNDELNLAIYFRQNFGPIFGLELMIISLLNILGSSFAMRRYLKV